MRFDRPVSLRLSSSSLVSVTPEPSPLKGSLIYVHEFQFFRPLSMHSSTIVAIFFHVLIFIKRIDGFCLI
jgi:hypothetical protein